ncbi:OspG family effector kinase [Yersinia enterocolitica]
MLKETQLCSWAVPQSSFAPFAAPPCFPPIAEDNIELLTLSSIMAELSYLWEENSLRLKATQSGHEFYAERTAYVGTVEDLLHSSPELTAVHGNEKSHIISLEQGIFSKLSQKGLTFSKDEKLTPLAALSLVWWLHQEHQPTVDELSAVIYRPENKEIRLQAAILYNHSHYGNRYGEIADISTADLNDWGMKKLSAPENPVSRAVRALRVIHDGINARPAILQSLETKLPPEAYLANGFAPKNVQGSYLKREPADLGKMILAGCGQIGFDTCRQQDFTQFLDFEHAVGSLAFSLKTTLKLHYQLQGKALAELEGKNTEQLYKLLLQEEEQLHQAGGGRYSPTAIFLSHFSQSNEVEPLNFEQAAIVFNGVAKNIDVSHLSAKAQMGFGIIKRAADNIVARKAMDIEYLRFSIELKELAKFLEPSHPLYILAHYRLYKTEPEKIERQLDYLDMRFAYRAPPKIFNDDEAIHNILIENKIKDIYFPRQYVYRQDPQFGFSEKKFDSPFDEFKRRRDASNRFVANMSMPGNNGRSIDVYKTLDEKKNEYYERLKSSQALLAKAIEKLIDDGQRPVSWALQNKINALASDYRPESENTRFWRNAWTSLEESWVCKLPLPNPMCTISRVEGPRSRNEKENMAAGMMSMLMEVGQLRGMERGVKLIENPPQGVKSLSPADIPPQPGVFSRLPVGEEEVISNYQTIQNPHGKPIEVQRVELQDPQISSGMREAWLRQGSGATYWEVDLATGKDLGVVLKQGPQFSRQGRLPGGGPFLSKKANPNFNPKIKLGKHIGSGLTAEVYLDANNPGFVLKKIKAEDLDSVLISSEFENEVKFFNRFYGEGAAEIISQDNQLYIRMYHIPGKGLAQINTKIFPANARKQFLSMAEDLERYNIIHNDFSFNNVLYDQENNTFYPIDFGSAEEGYYPLSDGQRALRFTGKFELMLEHIEKYTRH